MDRTLLSMLGGVSALALLSSPGFAATPIEEPAPLRPASSFAELLDPIPNALSVLKAEDQRAATRPVQLAQWDGGMDGYYHHHHHHHHHHFQRFYAPPVMDFGWRRHHHHHHHWHHHYYYGD